MITLYKAILAPLATAAVSLLREYDELVWDEDMVWGPRTGGHNA